MTDIKNSDVLLALYSFYVNATDQELKDTAPESWRCCCQYLQNTSKNRHVSDAMGRALHDNNCNGQNG